MKKIGFSSDRYYELRHDLESDFHEDYDYSNAIAYGRTKSIEKAGPHVLEIIASNQQDDRESDDYQVQIEYLNKGRYSGLENNVRGKFMGCWYDCMPTAESHDICFENCVFDTEVDLAGLSNVAFHNCFFLDQVSIEEIKEGSLIDFQHCIFKYELFVLNCETERLNIDYCNVSSSLIIRGCIIEKETALRNLHVGMNCRIEDSEFRGHRTSLSEMEIKEGVVISECRFDATTSISLCKMNNLEVDKSWFDGLTMDSVFANTYLTYESLSEKDG